MKKILRNLRSSAAEDSSLKERKNPRWLVLTKLKAIQNPGFDFTWVYADAKTGFYSGLSF